VGDGTVDWSRAQRALRDEVERVVRLLRSVTNPAAPALGEWSVAEVAMHLSRAWMAVPGLAREDLSAVHEVLPSLRGTAGGSMVRDMWDLGEATQMGVRHDAERDPAAGSAQVRWVLRHEVGPPAEVDWTDSESGRLD